MAELETCLWCGRAHNQGSDHDRVCAVGRPLHDKIAEIQAESIIKVLEEEEEMGDNWKHRSENMRCCTCMWFVEKVIKLADAPEDVDTVATVAGRCRRHAPTMSGYPVVYVTDWCGDHKLDENKV